MQQAAKPWLPKWPYVGFTDPFSSMSWGGALEGGGPLRVAGMLIWVPGSPASTRGPRAPVNPADTVFTSASFTPRQCQVCADTPLGTLLCHKEWSQGQGQSTGS